MSASLRPLRPSDWKAVEPWLHDSEVNRYMVLGRTAPSAEKWVRELADAWPRHCVMAIMLCDHPTAKGPLTHIGVTGLFDIDWLARKAEFRIFHGGTRHRGFGTEATRLMLAHGFKSLNLRRIYLGTAESNLAARRCFEKAGFKLEGMLEEDFISPEGVYMANARYGILKRDWEELIAEA